MHVKTLQRYLLTPLATVLALAGSGDSAHADDSGVAVLPDVVVAAEKLVTPTRQPSETVYTGTEITAKGLEIQGAKATTSVYGALDMLPGVNVESVDGNGLGAEMSTVRIRGVKSSLGALTVAGVPNYGGNPIGPRDYLYDMENMAAVSLYKGATPGDIGTGVGSRAGALELRPDWPHGEMGLRLKQSIGANGYTRSFFRIDSSILPVTGTRLSGSFSYSEADKWRGPGELGPRQNLNLSVSQPLGAKAEMKLWYNHNDLDQHLYRPLTASDIRDLRVNYDKDYNRFRTGVAGQDIYYYDYNRGTYQNDDLLAVLTMQARDNLGFTIKPYYNDEDTVITQGTTSGGGMVRKRNRDIERAGVFGEARFEAAGIKATIGHHYEASDMNIFSQNYAITPSGLEYRGYGVMATSGTTYINSPYLKVAGSRGPVDWQAGLKYFHFEDSASKGYITGPAPGYAPVRAADLDRQATTYDIWLPTLAAAYRIDEALEARVGYGRSFIRPYSYMPLINLYNMNRAAFLAQGMNLQQLFDGYDIEESDTVDLGMRYTGAWFEFAPTFFYAKHKNLLTTIYDPRVNLNYRQNIGRATSYGVELEMNAFLGDAVTLFVNPTYISLTYDDDLVFAGSRLDAKGNQVVDTPEWSVKSGLVYRHGNFEIVPMVRYLASRYADVENKGKVNSAAVMDLAMSYTLADVLKAETVRISMEMTNILDKKYVSVINASDDSRDGVATFYPGAPFAAMVSVSLQY